MGILEAIVVVYLRRIEYPNGFVFPLVAIEPEILRAETIREAMTLVMLSSLAWIAAERPWGRLLAFVVAFGVWDIVYYIGLKLFLDWPTGLLQPDVLFLIPRRWIGPVAAPVLVATAWVVSGLRLHRVPYRALGWGGIEWIALVAAHGLILASFLVHRGSPDQPGYLWGLFWAGYSLGLAVLVRTLVRLR